MADYQLIQIGQDIDGENLFDYSANEDTGEVGSLSISADGSIVAIGANGNDGSNGENSGHVRIYQNNSGTWQQIGSDIDGEALRDGSGVVSISDNGTIVAIGASGNDGNGDNSGHVRIYQYSSGTWSQLGNDIVGEAAGDQSGVSISLSDDGTKAYIFFKFLTSILGCIAPPLIYFSR